MSSVHNPYELLFTLATTTGLSASEVEVSFSPQYNRRVHRPSEYLINMIWEERLGSNARLHDGEKFRFHDAILRDPNHIQLKLGLTGYKDYVGTHMRSPEEHELLLAAGGGFWDHFSCALGLALET